MATGITRRDLLRAGIGAAALGPQALTRAAGAPAKRPNLLWIMTDQQGANFVGAYGENPVRTPHLDRLAAQGTRFNRFTIGAFPCSPSRACMFTGQYAHRNGLLANDVLLRPGDACLGDVLHGAGYRTGYVGKWHLGGDMYSADWAYRVVPTPDGPAFEKYKEHLGEDAAQHGWEHWVGGHKHYQEYLQNLGLLFPREGAKVPGVHASIEENGHSVIPQEHFMESFLADRAMEFLRAPDPAGRPFALVLSCYGPHHPISPPQPWDTMYDPASLPLPRNYRDEMAGKPVRQRSDPHRVLGRYTDDEMRDLEARYYGYVSYIDAQIGRVLQALDASGQAANTLVLFTTDHGEMIGSHGLIYKGAHLYEEMVRVPLLLRLPGRIPAGKTVDALAGQVDLLPTVLSTLGVGVPTEVQGKDLTPLLQGRRREVRREVFCEFPAAGMKMVRTDRWKLVVNAGRRRDLDELYDLKNDPLELRNLIGAPEHAAVRKELTGRLVDWNRETGDPFHAVFLAQMQRTAEPMQEVTPRDVRIAHLGGGKFSLEYTWHVESAVADKYWSFVQFLSKRYGKDGEIAFRCVQWPPRETQTWKPGEEHPMGPFTVEVPANCGAGEYGVRIGLWNPDTKQGPNLARGQGNSVMAGRLLVEKKGEEIIAIRFDPKVPDTLPRRTR